MLLNNHFLEKIYLFTRNDEENKKLIKELKKERYDLIIDLQNNLRSAYVRNMLMVKCIKFNKRDLAKLLLVKFKINLLKNAAQIPVRYAEIFDDFQLDNEGLDLITYNAPSPLFNEEKKYIGFAPGSKHYTKMWPKEYYIQLGKILNDAGYTIAIFGGKDDRLVCAEITAQIDSIDLSNKNDILQTAADMKKCACIVCNDSGMMHTATSTGVKVLAIFGSTVKEFGFFPYTGKDSGLLSKSLVLENKLLSCRPCTHIGKDKCPKTHFKCMLEITPQLAYNNINLLLNS
ncbi:MAG: glycosyltransferase family 9 protein [Ignavibacteriaceae bacterium]|nr:glycosyltransferase family 9 protein [Ignavibacteriaceae bacterium]